MKRSILFFLCSVLMTFQLSAQVPLLPFGNSWNYLDNGSDQGDAWRNTAFNDRTWKNGLAKFGFQHGNGKGNNKKFATVINYGGDRKNKYITTYFRKTVVIPGDVVFSSYNARVLRDDDGVVVYVNGNEVYRNNMPDGAVQYKTLAANNDGIESEDEDEKIREFTIPGSAFNIGVNVIAVEVHLKRENSPTMAFDFSLVGNIAILDKTPPEVKSINRQSPSEVTATGNSVVFRVEFSEPVSGVDISDFSLTKTGTVNGTISAINGSGATYDVTVSSITGSGTLRLDLNGNGTGIKDASDNAISSSFTTGQSYIIDSDVPSVLSINRHSPASESTNENSVTFRVTFSEPVTGVGTDDFSLTKTNTASGTISSISGSGATYDVTVNNITGDGTLRLDLNSSGTGIADAAGNAINGGFASGQTYTIINTPPTLPVTYGFSSVTQLTPFATGDDTQHKPQGKVWKHDGFWWSAVTVPGDGMHIFKLNGTTWTSVLKIFNGGGRADCWVDGSLVHIFIFRNITSMTSPMISIEYDAVNKTYKPWSQRTGATNITFPTGTVTATLTVDSKGRMWVAAAGPGSANVWYSDAPYTSFSAPITLATGLRANSNGSAADMCAITKLPGKIGVFWSNQNTGLFGFRTHTDGTDPSLWSAEEIPAAQSVISGEPLMADDHMSLVPASDGTLYIAIKTSYNNTGRVQLGLMVRRPSGTWDPLYPVVVNDGTNNGTQSILILNEQMEKVKVVYTTVTNGGDIVYKESSTSNISFGEQKTLISTGSPIYNFASSTHQPYNPDVVILATNISTSPRQIVSVLASDAPSSGGPAIVASDRIAIEPGTAFTSARLYPNPISSNATLSFTLAQEGKYSVILYDSRGMKISVLKEGWAEAGVPNSVSVDGSALNTGLYFIQVQTKNGNHMIKFLKN